MPVIFCTACGARNRRRSRVCVNCGEAFPSAERVNTREWEPEVEMPGAVDELVPLTYWQQILAKPVLAGSLVAGIFAALIASVWFYSFLTRAPECIEFESYECSVIVLERRPEGGSLLDGSTSPYFGLTYRQAEVVDWARLLLLAREGDGSLDSSRLFDVSAGGVSRLRSCLSLEDCSTIPLSEDVDYDGLSGSVGLTSGGLVQSVRLSSAPGTRERWVLNGRLSAGALTANTQSSFFQEIHLIPVSPGFRQTLADVATRVRQELAQSGISLRVRVMFDAHSRSSSIPAARILVGPRSGAVSADGAAVWVELPSPRNEPPWIGSFATTVEHLVAASRFGLSDNQSSVIVFDCEQHPILEQSLNGSSGASVVMLCFDSTSYTTTVTPTSVIDRIVVVSSSRESEVVASVRELSPESAEPIFLARP